jgi:hypothetical protein
VFFRVDLCAGDPKAGKWGGDTLIYTRMMFLA